MSNKGSARPTTAFREPSLGVFPPAALSHSTYEVRSSRLEAPGKETEFFSESSREVCIIRLQVCILLCVPDGLDS